MDKNSASFDGSLRGFCGGIWRRRVDRHLDLEALWPLVKGVTTFRAGEEAGRRKSRFSTNIFWIDADGRTRVGPASWNWRA